MREGEKRERTERRGRKVLRRGKNNNRDQKELLHCLFYHFFFVRANAIDKEGGRR